MKKKIIFIALAVVVIAVLAASIFIVDKHKTEDKTTTPSTTASQNETSDLNTSPEITNPQDETLNLDITTELTSKGAHYVFSPKTKTLTVSGEVIESLSYSRNLDYWFENTEKIVFVNGVKKVTLEFFSFNKVKVIEIPESTEYIHPYMIYNNKPLLEKFVVASGNTHYYSDKNGILYQYSESDNGTKNFSLLKIPENNALTEYTVPDNVNSISSSAFNNCQNLKKINIGKNYAGKLDNVFAKCPKVETVKIHSENPLYCNDEQGAVYDKKMTRVYAIPASVKEYTLPKTADFSFSFSDGCNYGVKKIYIHSSFKQYSPIRAFKNLEEIVVEQGNPNYISENGVLFNSEKTELVWYPPMKPDETYEVPSTVTYIYRLSCKKLKNVVLPDSVKVIESQAFDGAESLETISIGKGFEKFEINDAMLIEQEFDNPFDHCDNLKFITVDKSNRHFKNDSYGALYSKDMKHLLTVPASTGLKEFTVPDTVVELRYCFTNCDDIEVINIGSGVKNIHVYSMIDGIDFYGFEKCISLRKFNVSPRNSSYESHDGILYSKAKELIFYPPAKEGKSFSTPSWVKAIAWGSFYNNQYLEKVFVPKNVEIFGGHYAYFACDDSELMFDIYCESGNHEPWVLREKDKYGRHTIYHNSTGLPQ